MIVNSSIKVAIMQAYKSMSDKMTNEELLATEILFYKFILSFLKLNPDQQNNIISLVGSYSNEYQTRFISLKSVATSYQDIIMFLKKIEPNNLLAIKEKDINTIYDIYLNSKKVVTFDPTYFNELMYNVSELTLSESDYLKEIHFNIMKPIFTYYNEIYGAKGSDIKILSANSVPGNVGKVIIFLIENIESSIIYADLLNKKIPIYGYNCELDYPYIKLTIL